LILLATVSPVSPPAASQDALPGLVATYRDRNHSVNLVVPTPSFYLKSDESVHPALESEFEAEWTGLLSVLQTGSYTFESAAEISINGAVITGKTIQLDSGRHPIRIHFRRKAGVARVQILWKSNHFALEPVPGSLFWHQASTSTGGDDAVVEHGRYLVEELGCVNCHASASAQLVRRPGPDLTRVGSRTHSRWLYKWLEDASAHRAGAVMPAMLDDRERHDVASYLRSLTESLPAPDPKKPSRQDINHGKQLFGSFGCAACHQQSDLSLEGIGSKMTLSSLAVYLKDPSRVDPSGRMPSLMLTDEEAFRLASFLVESRNPAFEEPWEEGDRVRGKEIVIARGCLACHALDDPARLVNGLKALPLEKLRLERGCLSDEPKGVPRYRLNPAPRRAIRTFLLSHQGHPDRSPAPVYAFRRTIERLRCGACHQIDSRGPSGSPAEAAPPLTDTGAKLRTGWIAEVLTNRKRVLKWLELRMPHYESSVVKPFVDGFAQACGVEPGEGPAPPSDEAARTRGVDLIGMNLKKGGMACIGCHDWGEFRSQGENGPQLIDVAHRLRYDWFERWMRDPVRILSGTSMPSYFRTTTRDEADKTIRTLWAALEMGETMPLPEGLKAAGGLLGGEEKPVPDREAIVIRWDMPEATPAAIAVGMPGKISYCFDAAECRLRYAWYGGFVDMSGTLRRKVDETRLTPTAKLIGEIFYRSDEFPLRIGATDHVGNRRFRGYRLIDGYPQFHYQVDGIDVYERILPEKSGKGLTREFKILGVDRPMWLLSGGTRGVVLNSTIGRFENGKLKIPRGTEVKFDVTITRQE
jgi:mono/diheme cytochrome c family protein